MGKRRKVVKEKGGGKTKGWKRAMGRGVLGRTHKIYFPVACTSRPINLVLLMSYLGNVN
jgi:hypothetical protein